MDAWLLDRFPGRTLDEIDGIDWGRHQRAWTAARIEADEIDRRRYLEGQIKSLPDETWARIRQHDKVIEHEHNDQTSADPPGGPQPGQP